MKFLELIWHKKKSEIATECNWPYILNQIPSQNTKSLQANCIFIHLPDFKLFHKIYSFKQYLIMKQSCSFQNTKVCIEVIQSVFQLFCNNIYSNFVTYPLSHIYSIQLMMIYASHCCCQISDDKRPCLTLQFSGIADLAQILLFSDSGRGQGASYIPFDGNPYKNAALALSKSLQFSKALAFLFLNRTELIQA